MTLVSILDDDRMTMAEVALRLRVSVCSVWRWHQFGVGGHRLETVKIGGRRFVRTDDLEKWIAATNGLHPQST